MRDFVGCCTSGAPGTGNYQPRGRFRGVGGVSVYDSSPTNANEKYQEVLLLLPDGFGHAKHNLVLADRFASSGWRTVVPDYFEGDGLPVQLLQRNPSISIDDHDWSDDKKTMMKALDLGEWTKKHSHAHVEALLGSFLQSFRQEDPDRILLGVGYCFGGKHVCRLAQSTLKAAVAFHPSFLVAADVTNIRVPLYAGLAENDKMVSKTLAEDLRFWSSEGHVDLTLESFPGVKHGFAARPEAKDANEKAQYEAAFTRTVGFLRANL